MKSAGVRELKQNASAVVSEAAAGTTVLITVRGRPVAQLTPIAASPYEAMRDAGLIRPASRSLLGLLPPEEGAPVTPTLLQMRDDERY